MDSQIRPNGLWLGADEYIIAAFTQKKAWTVIKIGVASTAFTPTIAPDKLLVGSSDSSADALYMDVDKKSIYISGNFLKSTSSGSTNIYDGLHFIMLDSINLD